MSVDTHGLTPVALIILMDFNFHLWHSTTDLRPWLNAIFDKEISGPAEVTAIVSSFTGFAVWSTPYVRPVERPLPFYLHDQGAGVIALRPETMERGFV